MNLPTPRPIVKWPGGKWMVGPQLCNLFPPTISGVYREVFAGAAAMAFRWAVPRGCRLALSDTEVALINTYIAVRDHVLELVAELRKHPYELAHFNRIRDEYNAWLREPLFSAPAPLVTRAAWFIYLHKCCYNGLHRVDSQGLFNVSFGKYDKPPNICDEPLLRSVAHALAGAELETIDFERAAMRAQPGDFVYFDPPYDGVEFVGYQAARWTDRDLVRLRNVGAELDRRGVLWAMSNAKTPRVLDLFGRWRIEDVWASSSISCKAETRGERLDVLVCSGWNASESRGGERKVYPGDS